MKRDPAFVIVRDIVADITNRRGLSGEWDQIDDDIQDEIMEQWRAIVRKHLPRESEKAVLLAHGA